MVLGALIGLLGIWWYIPGSSINTALVGYSTLTNYESLVAMVQGSVGAIAVIIGLFIVWIEHDQIKVERELQSEAFGRQVQGSIQAVAEGGEPANDAEADTPSDEEQDEQAYVCDSCDRSFDTERGVNVHKSQVHD
jgi:hypothetical protein